MTYRVTRWAGLAVAVLVSTGTVAEAKKDRDNRGRGGPPAHARANPHERGGPQYRSDDRDHDSPRYGHRHVPPGRREIRSPYRIVRNRTYVPLRAPFEQMGCHVRWDGAYRRAYISQGPRTVVVTAGSPTVIIIENGHSYPVNWGTPPVFYGDQIYVPLRPVAEGLQFSVGYQNDGISLGANFFLSLF